MEAASLREFDLESCGHQELLQAGWEYRAMLASDRLGEVRDIYLDLGLEVTIRRPLPEELGSKCGPCKSFACREFGVLYTRRCSND
jgi:hypothetical protein